VEAPKTGEVLKEIQDALKADRYRPMPVRRRYVPKGDGRQKPAADTVRDRVVHMAANCASVSRSVRKPSDRGDNRAGGGAGDQIENAG